MCASKLKLPIVFIYTYNCLYFVCSGTLTLTHSTIPTAAMPRIQTALKNRRIKPLVVAKIKSFLSTASRKNSSMDKAGRTFLLTIILKDSGTQNRLQLTSTRTSLHQCGLPHVLSLLNTVFFFYSNPFPNDRYTRLFSW